METENYNRRNTPLLLENYKNRNQIQTFIENAILNSDETTITSRKHHSRHSKQRHSHSSRRESSNHPPSTNLANIEILKL